MVLFHSVEEYLQSKILLRSKNINEFACTFEIEASNYVWNL